MKDKPNKFIYYGVLYANIFICATALFYAYVFVVDSYEKSQNENYKPMIDTNDYLPDEEKSIGYTPIQSYTPNVPEISYPSQSEIVSWTNNTFDELSKPGFLQLDINQERASTHFTKIGWWDFETFIKESAYGLSDYELNKLRQTTVVKEWDDDFGNHLWTLNVPLSISPSKSLSNEREKVELNIDVTQDFGTYGELKINKWIVE